MALKDINSPFKEELEPQVNAYMSDMLEKMGSLIGQKMTLRSFTMNFGQFKDFFRKYSKKSMLTKIKWEGKEGSICIVNPLDVCIAMSGIMWTFPPVQILEKIKGKEFDGELPEVYQEISNQFYGALSQLISERRDPAAQLKLETTEDFPINGSKNELVAGPEENCVLVYAEITVGELEFDNRYLLFVVGEDVLPAFFDVDNIENLGKEDEGDEGGLIGGSFEKTPVTNIMVTDFPTIDIEQTVGDAYDIMVEKELEYLPVVNDEGKVLRMVSKNNIEILKSVFFDAPGMEERQARVMCIPLSMVNKNQELFYVTPDDMADLALKMMVMYRIHAIPVLNEERVMQGMLTSLQCMGLLVGASEGVVVESELTSKAETEGDEENSENPETLES